MKSLPSLKRVLGYYLYHKKTGEFIRLVDSNKARAGTIAKRRINSHGYMLLSIDGRDFQAHRVAFALVVGRWPRQIDHKNGIKSDNRWCNLREATNAQNMRNSKVKRTSTTGLKGVSPSKDGTKYEARIRVGRHSRRLFIGSFRTPNEAHTAYKLAAAKYHGEFARTA